MNMPPRKGGVFMVQDSLINMPPDANRTTHRQRPVIIISGDATNAEADWPIVLAVPTSTSGLASEYCVELARGRGNLPSRCWARVMLVQPVAKTDLRDFLGKIPAIELELLEQNLFAYMGSIG